jgi:hypothetical protein
LLLLVFRLADYAADSAPGSAEELEDDTAWELA